MGGRWYGDKHLAQETPAPARARAGVRARARATCGLARFGLCPGAWEPGSPRSHAKNPASPGAFLPGFLYSAASCTPPRSVEGTYLPPGPVSPGATWEHGHLQQLVCGGWEVPACHVGTWAESEDRSAPVTVIVTVLDCIAAPYPGTA